MTIRLATVLAVLAVAAQAQTTWIVDVNGTPPGSGTQADPYTSIQHAISQASTLPGDTVLVLPGTYQETIDFLGKAIEVRSMAGRVSTIIDKAQFPSSHAVAFVSGEGPLAALDGFTITDTSSGIASGRGITIMGASPTIRNCRIVDVRSALDGAGLWLENSSPVISDCAIEQCYTWGQAGGAYVLGSAPTISDVLFKHNSSVLPGGSGALVDSSQGTMLRCRFEGGDGTWCTYGSDPNGLMIVGSDLQLIDCEFAYNRASGVVGEAGACSVYSSQVDMVRCTIQGNCGSGGGLSIGGASTVTLQECSILDNYAFDPMDGGGILLLGGALNLVDSTISGNRAGGPDPRLGGGAHVVGGTLTALRCTFSGNSVYGEGGALNVQPLGTVTCHECTFADNEAFGWNPYSLTPARGGAIWNAGAANFDRCRFVRNSIDAWVDCSVPFARPFDGAYGAAVYGPATISHSVLWGNTTAYGSVGSATYAASLLNSVAWNNYQLACDGTRHFDDQLGASQVTFSIVQGGAPGTGNIDTPPHFWGPPIDDFHLLPGSPCIDAGDPTSPLDPDGSRADMGVYPFDPTYCGEPFTYCEGKTNSLGCVPFISTTGYPSPTSTQPFEVIGNDVLPGEAGFMVYGFNKSMLGFHGGTLCVKAPIARVLPPKFAKANGAPPCTGRLRFDFNPRIQNGSDVLLMPGQTVYAQVHQRDPQDPSGFGDGLTDAVQFTICP